MARRYRRRRKYLKLKKKSIQSIVSIALFLLALISFASFFGQALNISVPIQPILNKLFGWGAFILPFIFAHFALVLSQYQRMRFITWPVFLGLCLFLVSFISLIHLFIPLKISLREAYLGEGGGLIGFYIQSLLRESVSAFLAFFILIGGLLTSILLVFNTSLDSVFFVLGEILGSLRSFFQVYLFRNVPRLLESIKTLKKRRVPLEPKGEKIEKNEEVKEVKGEEEEPIFEILHPVYELATEEHLEQKPKESVTEAAVVSVTQSERIWEYPPLSLLSDEKSFPADRGDIKEKAQILEKTLESFGVHAKVVEVNLGPAITQYALELTSGTKISKITSLQHDIALALATSTGTVRIEAPIPGRSLVGIEVPNYRLELVTLKSLLTSNLLQNSKSKLTVALGHDVAGQPVIADIGRLPHVLVAGATGSGKSVLLNSMIATLLFRGAPSEVKLILVDPKRVELSEYQDIPHLLTPVIFEPEKVLSALKWTISEMERRYRLLQNAKVRNIQAFNELSGFQALSHIVILIDELADVMTTAPVEVEKSVCRIAQMARATGIHMVLSTQRPSIDVLTGLIKANIPCRIAFNVSSMIDSRVIIDMPGAEKLLGSGDMLYVPPDASKPVRIQGVYVSDVELQNLIRFLKNSGFKPEYKTEVTEFIALQSEKIGEGTDEFFEEAIRTVCEYERASASLLQRRLKIGYARAARLIDELEERGIIGSADGSKPRDVLIHNPEVAFGKKSAPSGSDKQDSHPVEFVGSAPEPTNL